MPPKTYVHLPRWSASTTVSWQRNTPCGRRLFVVFVVVFSLFLSSSSSCCLCHRLLVVFVVVILSSSRCFCRRLLIVFSSSSRHHFRRRYLIVFTSALQHCRCVGFADAYRDTSIQALRLCLLSSSVRPSDRLLQDIQQLLESLLSSSEDSTRTVSAACLGALCRCVEDEQRLTTLVTSVILGIYTHSCQLSPDIVYKKLLNLKKSPLWARDKPPPPYPFTFPPSTLCYSIFYFFLFPCLLASSIFLLFHPFPFYQNSPTPFPGQMS